MQELLESISYEELVDWMIYFQLEPWGVTAYDMLNAHWMSLYANAHRELSPEEKARAKAAPKRDKPYTLFDFLLYGREEAKEAEAEARDIIRPETRDWFYSVAVPAELIDAN